MFSASYHQLLNQRSLLAFLQRCIITNHTRFCWAYGCDDQSEVSRWVIAQMLAFSSLTHWLNTSFWCILSLEITNVYSTLRYSLHSLNRFSGFKGSFWERLISRLSVKMFFALFLYNENVIISSLTFNVKFTLNIKSVVLKNMLCMTPISVN